MTRFHERALALLGNEGVRPRRSTAALIAWSKEKDFRIPASFLEWARLDDGSLLHKYSNDDWFFFDKPLLIVTPDGMRGLRFHTENQNNFDRIILLDQGDDPPVLFGWLGNPPWVMCAERFSDAVFAQVFDWQYMLEFKADDPKYKEITYYGVIDLKTDGCLATLRQRYQELVRTQFIADGVRYCEYRFPHSSMLRVTVLVAEDRTTHVTITGRPTKAVKSLEAEWRAALKGEVG